MTWTNYHSHSKYSDGSDNLEKYVEQALANDVVAYGFSCHAPVTFPCAWTIAPDELQAYLAEIDVLKQKYKGKIELYKSLEIDYFPGNPLAQPENYKTLGLDYTIGSVHFIDNLKNGEAWNIDTSKRIFDEGMIEIFGGNGKLAVTKFYELTLEMIAVMNPTIIGHLDKIKMFNTGNTYFSEDEQWYKDLVETVLLNIVAAGSIVEVNTRGLYRGKTTDHYPSDYMLQRCLDLNIPVIINSDCHKPSQIIKGFPQATALLKSIGFKTQRVLLHDRWQDVLL